MKNHYIVGFRNKKGNVIKIDDKIFSSKEDAFYHMNNIKESRDIGFSSKEDLNYILKRLKIFESNYIKGNIPTYKEARGTKIKEKKEVSIGIDLTDFISTWDRIEKNYKEIYSPNKKLTIAIDFDGTLCENKYPEIGRPKQDVIDKCKELKKKGHLIILNTCRTGDLLNKAIFWCFDKGLLFDAVNENLQERINIFKNDSRKLGADYYVDDKNLSLEEFVNLK